MTITVRIWLRQAFGQLIDLCQLKGRHGKLVDPSAFENSKAIVGEQG